MSALEAAPWLQFGGGYRARDMRGARVPELVEAATRTGMPYIAEGLPDADGVRKIVCSGSHGTVRAFIEHFAPEHGLVRVYGDPMRGCAGGYAEGDAQ